MVVKRFIKAEMWLVLYLMVQSVIMVGVMMYRINVDAEFANGLTDVLLECVYAESGLMENEMEEVGLAQSIGVIQSITPYLSSVLIPVCIISSIVILSVYLITKWNEARVQSISWRDALKYVAFALIVNFVITFVIVSLPENVSAAHNAGTDVALSGSFLMVLLSTGILVPIMEEIVFRHGIGGNIGGKAGLVYQALIFALLHGNPIQIVYAFGLGLWFGAENMRKGNLLPGIIMHITFNASTVIASAVY